MRASTTGTAAGAGRDGRTGGLPTPETPAAGEAPTSASAEGASAGEPAAAAAARASPALAGTPGPAPSPPGPSPPGPPLARLAAAAAADSEPTRDECVASALAHVLALASIVVAPIVVTGLIFLVWRRRSEYVRFQAAQAFVYQVLLAALATVVASLMAGFRPLVCLVPLASAAGLVLFLYAIWGALEALAGRPFEYLIVGPAAEKMLGDEPAP